VKALSSTSKNILMGKNTHTELCTWIGELVHWLIRFCFFTTIAISYKVCNIPKNPKPKNHNFQKLFPKSPCLVSDHARKPP
jgi:hypothetical protein